VVAFFNTQNEEGEINKMAETVKRGLMTGLGDGYFQHMAEEETETTAPVYDDEIGVQVVPSLESAETEMTFESNPVYLSNKVHSELGKLTGVTITLNAAYLPKGFAEKATGAIKIGPGAYAYNSNPIREFFRFSFPATDEKGEEVIYNFPKCQLEPVGLNPATEGESKEAQITAYNIVGNALIYKPASDLAGDNENIYLKVDTREDDAQDYYDVSKLLENGWYDTTTLEAAAKANSTENPTEDPQV